MSEAHPLLERVEVAYLPPALRGRSVLVTGSDGSIGPGLVALLSEHAKVVYGYDAATGLDVCDQETLEAACKGVDVVVHLAAHKYAPEGEDHPFDVQRVNILGTQRVVRAASQGSARVVLASTCKAAQPETVYGASKLIAERIVLNAGGVVCRLYNVVETGGNVFRLWEQQYAQTGRVSVVRQARRWFVSKGEAVGFLARACSAPAGRYAPFAESCGVYRMAERWLAFNNADEGLIDVIPPRRGDRLVEPHHANHEWLSPSRYAFTLESERDARRVENAHDDQGVLAARHDHEAAA